MTCDSPRPSTATCARQMDRLAPATLPVPSGRQAPLTYADDGSVTASVKLQELFGLADTPRAGPAARAGHLQPAGAQRPAGADNS